WSTPSLVGGNRSNTVATTETLISIGPEGGVEAAASRLRCNVGVWSRRTAFHGLGIRAQAILVTRKSRLPACGRVRDGQRNNVRHHNRVPHGRTVAPRPQCLLVALSGPAEMSDLSPQSGPKRPNSTSKSSTRASVTRCPQASPARADRSLPPRPDGQKHWRQSIGSTMPDPIVATDASRG